MNANKTVNYVKADGSRIVIFPSVDGYEVVRESCRKAEVPNYKETKEKIAGVDVDAITFDVVSSIRNFEFKQNFRTNQTQIFVFTDTEARYIVNLPTIIVVVVKEVPAATGRK